MAFFFGPRAGRVACALYRLPPCVRIVLASVLKPVTDPRLLARLGRTLADLPGAEVHIVAHVAADAATPRPDLVRPNVFLHPVFDFPRLSMARALAGRTLLGHLRRLQPDILVVGAAELLPAGLQWQRRTGGQLVYDVRENYALNVRTQGVFPPLVAPLLAARIERLEAAAAPHLSGALLAERVYAEQLPWLSRCRRVEIIENKYQPTSPIPDPSLREPLSPDRPLRFLITGTLSELYGTFDAIELVRSLRAANRPQAIAGLAEHELHLVGQAPRPTDARLLRQLATQLPWLKLTGIERLVPHTVIIEAVRQADIGLLPYRPHPSLDGCIPTKFWEYQAERLPILQRWRGHWRAIDGAPNGPAPPVDFLLAFLELLSQPHEPSTSPLAAFWGSEAPRLKAFFAELRQP